MSLAMSVEPGFHGTTDGEVISSSIPSDEHIADLALPLPTCERD